MVRQAHHERMKTTAAAARLQQHDVVLLLRIACFHLQRHRFGDVVGQMGECRRFIVEEQVDHALRGEDAEFARVELFGFARDFAQDFLADGLRGLDFAATAARRAGFAEHMGERLARALARHFDKAEVRETIHRQAGAIR